MAIPDLGGDLFARQHQWAGPLSKAKGGLYVMAVSPAVTADWKDGVGPMLVKIGMTKTYLGERTGMWTSQGWQLLGFIWQPVTNGMDGAEDEDEDTVLRVRWLERENFLFGMLRQTDAMTLQELVSNPDAARDLLFQ